MKVYNTVFGWAKSDQASFNAALNDLKKNVRVLHTALEGKKWLLGDELSVADVIIASTL